MIGTGRSATRGPLEYYSFYFEGGFSDHCHSADEERVPVLPGPLMVRGRINRRLERWKVDFSLCQWDSVFCTSRAPPSSSLFLPSAPYPNASLFFSESPFFWAPRRFLLFVIFARKLANALGLYWFEFEFCLCNYFVLVFLCFSDPSPEAGLDLVVVPMEGGLDFVSGR